MKKYISALTSLSIILSVLLPLMAIPAQAQGPNLALSKPTACSPNPQFPCAEAVDGNLGTRWASVQGVDPQWIYVDLGATTSVTHVILRWETAYGKSYQIQTSNDATNWTNIYTTTTGDGGVDDLTGLSGSGRYIRMNGTVRGTGYGYSLWEFEIYGGTSPTNTPTNTPVATNTPTNTQVATNTPTNTSVGPTNTPTNTSVAPTNTPTNTAVAGCGSTNVALSKPATASSALGGNTAPMAVDGNATGTRWESVHAVDPQWIYVDLGTAQSICRVRLNWETAYGKSYTIQTSNDASSWTPIYSTTTGDGGIDDLTGLSGNGRYVRMHGTVRATGWGYSLWEYEIYTGSGGPTNTPTNTAVGPTNTPTNTPVGPTSTPTNTPTGSWTLVWNDDFNGAANTSPSGANWILLTGTQYPGGAAQWGTGEVEVASASTANVYLDGAGHLNIKAIHTGGDPLTGWTSGRIETQLTNFAAAAGEQVKFSAIIQQPNPSAALGYWPRFLATGAAYRGNYNNWPGVGEMDILMDVNGRSQLSNTLHCGTAPGGVCNEYNGRSSGLASCGGCQTGYHEYSMIIDRSKTDEEVRFYLDGNQTWVVRESQVGVAAWQAAVQHGFYLRLDLGIGGSVPNAISGFTTPTSATSSGGILAVDSVTVSKMTGSAPAAMTDPGIPAGPSTVSVTGTQGNWQLRVNGANYIIKGLTYGPPQNAGDGYMRDLQAMGVNTIRTWGVDDANTPGLIQTASRFGIKVIVGHWLNQGADYVNDTAYKNAVKAEIVNRVNTLKGYQGVLMWDVGNEVLLTMQDFGLPAAEVEARRNAYAQFVNEVAIAIHAADSNHPVTSTDAWTGAWVYYKNHSPALDLLAVNSYGAIGSVKQDWINGGYTKPYILTEGGPAGEWEVPDDINGVPTEPTDLQKRDGYTFSWNALMGHPGVSFGGTEFHYGLENDFGGVWLNTYGGGWRRLGYHSLKQAYTGQASANTPPQITAMTVSSQTSVPAGGQFNVTATVSDPDGDPLRYNLMYNNKYVSGGGTGFQHVIFTQTGNGTFTATAPQVMGVWKVYVFAYDGKGNVGIETRSFNVVPPTAPGTNIAIGKPTTASSSQVDTGDGTCCQPGFATNGNFSNRWASNWSDPQWIRVDLGSTQSFNHIQLGWEASYAKSYQIQTSNDGTNWTTVYSTTTGDGGFDSLNITGSGRYVRMNGTVRGTAWGYSLWEFGIYQ